MEIPFLLIELLAKLVEWADDAVYRIVCRIDQRRAKAHPSGAPETKVATQYYSLIAAKKAHSST